MPVCPCAGKTGLSFFFASLSTSVALWGVYTVCKIAACTNVTMVAIAYMVANVAWINFFFAYYSPNLKVSIPKTPSSPNITPADSPNQKEGIRRSQELKPEGTAKTET